MDRFKILDAKKELGFFISILQFSASKAEILLSILSGRITHIGNYDEYKRYNSI